MRARWEIRECYKNIFVYKTIHKGVPITFCQAPLGGAGAIQIMEQLIKGGAKKIIAAGCCGSLVEDTEGDYFIPTSALRQEGRLKCTIIHCTLRW